MKFTDRTSTIPLNNLSLFIAVFILVASCKKTPLVIPAEPINKYVTIDNVLFDTTTSRFLNTHDYGLDTQQQAYTLNGFGAFAGKTRTVKFSNGGTFSKVPVMKATGFNDYGATYLAKDTSGVIWEIYQQRFNTTAYMWPVPITVFALKRIQPAAQWMAWAGLEQGMNTVYNSFTTKALSTGATTSAGITGCIQLEYSAPDYVDTVYIKPEKGPVEIRSWRARLHENGQPAYGGYR